MKKRHFKTIAVLALAAFALLFAAPVAAVRQGAEAALSQGNPPVYLTGTTLGVQGVDQPGKYGIDIGGTLPRGQSTGLIVNDLLKPEHKISFDLRVALDDTGIGEYSDNHNRSFMISLNQFRMKDGAPDPADNTIMWTGNPQNISGIQMDFILDAGWKEAWFGPLMHQYTNARGGFGSKYFSTDIGSQYGHAFYSDHDDGELEGCDFPYLYFEMYYGTGEDEGNYVVTIQPKDRYGNIVTPLAGWTTPVDPVKLLYPISEISPEGGFTAQPMLAINYANNLNVPAGTPEGDGSAQADFGIYNLRNGDIQLLQAQDITLDNTVDPGDEIEPQVEAVFYRGASERDVEYTYSSANENIVAVEDNKLFIAEDCTGGTAKITVVSDEGDVVTFNVSVPDVVPPVLEAELPETAVQYRVTELPAPTALSDNSGQVTLTAYATFGEARTELKAYGEGFEFCPVNAGTYELEYRAEDSTGNFTLVTQTVTVSENTDVDWLYSQSGGTDAIAEITDGYIRGSGVIGTETTTMAMSEAHMFMSKDSFEVTDRCALEFDLELGLHDGTIFGDENQSDNNRVFVLYFGNAADLADAYSGTNGIRFYFGRAQHWPSAKYGIKTHATAAYSAGHLNPGIFAEEAVLAGAAINEKNFYNYTAGAAANAVNTLFAGQKVGVKLERLTAGEYVVTLAGLSWIFPVSELGSAGAGVFRIGAGFVSMDGYVENEFKLSNVVNGTVKSVALNDADGNTSSTIEFTEGQPPVLTADTVPYEGITPVITFSSSNASVAEVDETTGAITVKGTGMTVIRAEAECGKGANYTLYVKSKPAAPALEYTRTDYSITVTPVDGALYKLNDGSWSVNNVFTGLQGGSLHTVYIKLAATDENFESDAAEATVQLRNYAVGITVAPPAKTEYKTGNALDLAGMTVTVEYVDGSTGVIEEGFTVSDFDSSAEGTVTITVTFEDLTDTFEVTVTKTKTTCNGAAAGGMSVLAAVLLLAIIGKKVL